MCKGVHTRHLSIGGGAMPHPVGSVQAHAAASAPPAAAAPASASAPVLPLAVSKSLRLRSAPLPPLRRLLRIEPITCCRMLAPVAPRSASSPLSSSPSDARRRPMVGALPLSGRPPSHSLSVFQSVPLPSTSLCDWQLMTE